MSVPLFFVEGIIEFLEINMTKNELISHKTSSFKFVYFISYKKIYVLKKKLEQNNCQFLLISFDSALSFRKPLITPPMATTIKMHKIIFETLTGF